MGIVVGIVALCDRNSVASSYVNGRRRFGTY